MAGAGRNGTRRDDADTGSRSNGIDAGGNSTAWEGPVRMLLFLSLFLYFHLFFISLFFFSDYFFSGKYNNRRGAKGKGRSDGTGHTRAAITTWDNTEGADGGTSSFCFVLWTLLDYFYHFSSFPIISFSVEYNNMRPGRGRPTRAAMATSNGTGRERARQVRLLSSVTVFFLLSSFLLLTFTISFAKNYSNRQDGEEWDGIGRDDVGGDSNAGRDRGKAGGRRR